MLESVVHESRGKASPVLWYCSYSVHDARHAYAMIAAGRYVIPARELKIFQIRIKYPWSGRTPHSAPNSQHSFFPIYHPFAASWSSPCSSITAARRRISMDTAAVGSFPPLELVRWRSHHRMTGRAKWTTELHLLVRKSSPSTLTSPYLWSGRSE